jgi:hypothetical protein
MCCCTRLLLLLPLVHLLCKPWVGHRAVLVVARAAAAAAVIVSVGVITLEICIVICEDQLVTGCS